MNEKFEVHLYISETYQKEAVSTSGASLLRSLSILTYILVFSRV